MTKEYSRLVFDEAQRMRGLVDDLLLLSQIESGQVSMEHKRINVAQLLNHTPERFQWSIREAGIQSGVSFETLPDIIGDPRRLEQVSRTMQNAAYADRRHHHDQRQGDLRRTREHQRTTRGRSFNRKT